MDSSTVRTIRTRYGLFAIDLVQDKKMMEALESSSYPNEGLLEIARQFVDTKSTVVDIGAHIGTFALAIARNVGTVIAFEPSADAFALLSQNAKENNVPLRLIPKALGSEKGTGTIIVRKAANAGANTLVSGGDIPVTTLDEEVAHADFIKIDVEGMELEVLRGGTRLIKHSRPVVVFEVNLSQLRTHKVSPRALAHFFLMHDYRLYLPLEREERTLARVSSATLITALIAPRAWLFFGESAPFDLVAVPRERPLSSPTVGFGSAIRYVMGNNLAGKYKRFAALFR